MACVRWNKKLLSTSWLKQFVRQFTIQMEAENKESDLKFVPPSTPVADADVKKLKNFIFSKKHILVITGAGISTESGIPDYRSQGVGLYATSKNRPVNYSDFLKSSYTRQRYWARNTVGWPQFSSFLPNATHHILSKLEKMNLMYWLVTQNVDALHYKAGSVRVTELHGSTHRVMCLSCNGKMSRVKLQELIMNLNPEWNETSFEIAPDGDVQLTDDQIAGFKTVLDSRRSDQSTIVEWSLRCDSRTKIKYMYNSHNLNDASHVPVHISVLIPECPRCGGILKPEVVFFGDNVPKPTVNLVSRKLHESDAVLVLGSSLQVYSAYRIVSSAHEKNKPIVIVNIGPTRGDKLATLKIEARCSDILGKVIS